MEKPSVVIMGLGYIGLPTAALIASKDIDVHGVDINENVIKTVNAGKIHIIEPDLEGLVHNVVEKGTLKAANAPKAADIFMITVPTPFKENFAPDLAYVHAALRMIAPLLRAGNLIILESTSPVGTTEGLADLTRQLRPDIEGKLHFAYCPERVLPGQIIHELEHNDRVLGGLTEEATDAAVRFYSRFVKGHLHRTNAKTAEMTKLVENAYRDVNIAFANELSMICDKAGINVWELRELANRHPRVNILQPGCGVGGHCIAVDPWFLVSAYKEDASLIKAARLRNDSKPEFVVAKVKEAAEHFTAKHNRKPRLGLFGLSYKPDIDDVRESPAIHIAKTLRDQGHDVLAVEPNLQSKEVAGLPLHDTQSACSTADIFVFLVNHRAFQFLQIPADRIVLSFINRSS